jgi:hypothetical protein
MKGFFQFLTEASQSQASLQAKRLNLKGDGHGGWYDSRGEFVAKTEAGKLKFYKKGERVGQKDVPNPAKPPEAKPATRSQPNTAPQEQEPQRKEAEVLRGDEEGKGVTVVFGRFNPPTTGHKKLLDSASSISAGSELRIYPSRTQDPKKNPLDPSTKIEYMKKMFPKYEENIIDDENMKSIFDVLKTADEDGFTDVTIVVGADRLGEFKNLANKYNGDLYTFDMINVVSAGERDADAEGVEGMSASKMRKAAADNDIDTFKSGIPKSLGPEETKNLFNTLRKSMKATAKESYDLWEIAPKFDWKNLRENYVNERIFKIGDLVENLNTGLVGRILRRGTNYLICVTKEQYMFKSWIRDVMEAVVNYSGPSGVPANKREVGTDSHREYTMRMTGTSGIKNFINKYRKK